MGAAGVAGLGAAGAVWAPFTGSWSFQSTAMKSGLVARLGYLALFRSTSSFQRCH
ncbi:hypothetical protein D3C72_1144800 [compost metagenome]